MKNKLQEIFNLKRINRFTLVLLIILINIVPINAQSTSVQLKKDIQLSNVTVLQLVEKLGTDFKYSFFIVDEIIGKTIISVELKNATINEILESAFQGKDIAYVIKNRNITISRKNKKNQINAEPQITTKTKKVSGVVLDEKGQPVIGASVIIPKTTICVATDINGRFTLEAPSNAKLHISYIGYEAKEELLNTSDDLEIKLEPTPKALAEIVVTTQVRGQIKAINKQLNSNEIMNAVSAERIQELPDANAAETVARLPGISLLRDGGEGNKLVIRGLEPKYNKVTIEGVSMASTGGDDRSVDMSMISPYSLDGIEVTKAITADKDADYMGGSVNFKLRKADPGYKSNFIIQGGYNQLRNIYSNYMMVGNVGNRFFKDKMGVYLQGNIERKNLSSNNLSTMVGHFGNPRIDSSNVLTSNGMTLVDNYRVRNRYGATLVLDYRLPKGSIQFNNMFTQSATTNNNFTEMFTSGRTHEYNTGYSKNYLLTITNVLDYTQHFGQFDLAAKISHSMSNNNTPQSVKLHYVQSDGLSNDVNSRPMSPDEFIQYATIDDSRAYMTSVSDANEYNRQKQFETQVDLKYNFEISKSITGFLKAGIKLRRILNDYDYEEYSGAMNLGSGGVVKDAILNAYPWMQTTCPLGSSQLPYVLFKNQNTNQDQFLDGKYNMGTYGDVQLMKDVVKLMSDKSGSQTGITDSYHYDDYASNTSDYKGHELLKAGYLMSELKLGSKINFIPGVRLEENTTKYTAPRGNSYLPFPDFNYVKSDTTITKSNISLLPMIHLKYTPVKWFNVRLAYTETLSRPNFNAITPRWDIGSQVVSYNNYRLLPEHAKNYDVYLSFFDAKFGLFTIGGFVKNIENKIFSTDKRVILNPNDYNLPAMTQDKFIYTQLNNTNLSKVRGLELDWQTSFWYLPGALQGLILNVNYTWINSEAKYPRTVVESIWDDQNFVYLSKNIDDYYSAPLVFQPKKILNVSFGYDYQKFSARVSLLYQTKVFQGPNFWPELVNYSDDYVRWDFSIKQELPWYGIQVFCNVNNLSNAKDILRNVGSGYATSIQNYGSTIDLGLRMNIDPKKNKN